MVPGTEDFNAFIKGEAKRLYAEGKAAFEFEDDGEFAIGVDFEVSLGSASAGIGTSFYMLDMKMKIKRKKNFLVLAQTSRLMQERTLHFGWKTRK